jgi:hypothetical protein
VIAFLLIVGVLIGFVLAVVLVVGAALHQVRSSRR